MTTFNLVTVMVISHVFLDLGKKNPKSFRKKIIRASPSCYTQTGVNGTELLVYMCVLHCRRG